jgi:cell division protein FtsW
LISKEDIESVHPSSLVEKTKGDRTIWLIVIFLTSISCLAIYSSTGTLAYKYAKSNEHFLFQQLFYVGLGLFVMYCTHLIHYKYYSRISVLLLVVTIPLLLFTLLFGSHVNDASRWIKIPIIGISFQPSDMAKLAIIMYSARMLSRKQDVIKDLKKSFIPILWPIVLIFVLILPANLSTASILLFTCLVLLFIGRINLKHLVLMGVAGLIVLILFVGVAKLVGYEGRIKTWENRIKSFSNDEKNEVPFQVQQANIAIAKGGITGVGPGNSTQRNFLPHPYSDFIFAIIIEEYGLWAAIAIIILYLWFLFRCVKIFIRCPGAFGAFLAVGLGIALTIQAFMHMAVNVHLTPVTGVTLPFVSMGGTSLFFTSIATGIILSVSKNVEELEGEKNLQSIHDKSIIQNNLADIQQSSAPF